MAPNKVSVTVKFSTPGTQPPIYLAGSFSDPEWQPQEMQYTTDEHNEHEFYRAVEVEEGTEYQYKFRVGEGEWWVLNETANIATDNIGNRNNLLFVPIQEESIANPTPPKSPKMAPSTDASADNAEEAVLQTAGKTNEENSNGDNSEQEKIEGGHKQENAAIVPENSTTEQVKMSGIIVPVKAEPDVKHHKEDIEVSTQDPAATNEKVEPGNKSKQEVEVTHNYSPIADMDGVKNDENIKAAVQDSAIALPALISPEMEDTKTIKQDKHTQGIESSNINKARNTEEAKTEIPSPVLVVEKIDSEPHHGDDFGADATVGQKDAHLLRAQDAEPDYVVVRSETPTPQIAAVAAEVAESAAIIDEEPPTPPISDEEAGRIGFRRMSNTPIPQVAETAAEVAETAAALDKEERVFKIEMPPPQIEGEDPDFLDSGSVTPWEERAPRFSHECPTLPTGPLQPVSQHEYYGGGPRDPFEHSVIDYNDPSIEVFPSEREAILEQVRATARRLSEDQVVVDGIPPSPVVGADRYPERLDLPAPSPGLLPKNDDRSPSLDSIPEEHGYQEELLATIGRPKLDADYDGTGCCGHKDERVASAKIQEVAAESLPSTVKSSIAIPKRVKINSGSLSPATAKMPVTPFVHDDSKQLGSEEATPKTVTPEEGPSIQVLPATPGSSLKNRGSDPFDSHPIDTAKATAIEEENGRSHLTSRKAPSPVPERPLTPSSMRGKDAKSKNFLKAFLNLVFVEWIGGLIMRLCGGGRNT